MSKLSYDKNQNQLSFWMEQANQAGRGRVIFDLIFVVTEIDPSLAAQKARFRLKNAFAIEGATGSSIPDAVICSQPGFRVSTAVLDHGTPCLAFAIEEAAHVNIWKNKLFELGLPVGPWLHELKRAIIENRPDDHMIRIASRAGVCAERQLGMLRNAVSYAGAENRLCDRRR